MCANITEDVVKKQIRSLLNSNARVSTLRDVENDYESFIGFPVPSRKLGYNSTEHFLKSIPDVCTVKGTGPHAEVLLVVTEKIAYNTKMVLEQNLNTPKSAARRRLPGRRRFDELRSVQQTSNSANSTQAGRSNPNHYNSRVINYPPQQPLASLNMMPANYQINNNQLFRPHYNRINHPMFYSGQPLTPIQPAQPNVDRLNESHRVQPVKLAQPSMDSLQESQPDSNLVKLTPSPVTVVHKKSLSLDHIKPISIREIVKQVEKEEEDNSNVPKKVQENLKKLIAEFKNGIWCGDLRMQYLQLFKRELLFTEYGYGSLIEMCIALKHIFHYVRPGNDDFKLYDRSKPLPLTVEKTYTLASYDTSPKDKTVQALPELEWSDFKGRIPDDVFKFGDVIPRQFLPQSTKAADSVGVVVMEIYDISKFWFYLRDEGHKLDKLMDDLQTFYMDSDNAKEYAVIPAALQVGLYCVQIIYGEYHRAKILRLLPNDQVRLYYIDYGTVETASIKRMCFLRREFSVLPAQAIRGRLGNISPIEKGHAWPPSSILRFKELINRKSSTQMRVSFVDWSDQYVCGFIADVSNPDNIHYVNEILVKEGHAVWDNQTKKPSLVMSRSTCIVQNLHLFPTFQELELSMALSFSETYFYANLMIPVQYCLPNYFKVDEDTSDEDSYSEMFEGLMETAKNRRKLHSLDVRQEKEPPLDFDFFGKFKHDMINFLGEIGEETPEIKKELENEPEAESDEENLTFYSAAREKCESLISQLNLTSAENDADNQKYNEDDDEFLDWSTPIDHSECGRSETRTPPFCPWAVDRSGPSDLNIFDNPEAFENLSNPPSPNTPSTADAFFKALENKISQNPAFLLETEKQNESPLQDSSNCEKVNATAKLITGSNLDPTSKEFVSTLHLNNPFRQFLNLNESETATAGKNGESFVTMADNKTDSDSSSSEYYEAIEPKQSNVDNLSNSSRVRLFVDNLPSPKTTSYWSETSSQSTQISGSLESNLSASTQTQFPMPIDNAQLMNWPAYPQWSRTPSYPIRTPHGPRMVPPPPGFYPQHFTSQAQFRSYGSQMTLPPQSIQNPYPQYGYLPTGLSFVNVQTQDFYDRYNQQLLRQLARNN